MEPINQLEVIEKVCRASTIEVEAQDGKAEQRPTVVAIVGLSDNPARPSHRVAKAMKAMGYHIIPVNPTATEVLGERSYPDLTAVPGPVDVVQVFRRPEHAPDVARLAARERSRLGIRVLWLQEGVVSEEAARIAQEAGIDVVMDRCLLKEAQRLR